LVQAVLEELRRRVLADGSFRGVWLQALTLASARNFRVSFLQFF
jgi:hypothetical protein